jgi:hypothetical protein
LALLPVLRLALMSLAMRLALIELGPSLPLAAVKEEACAIAAIAGYQDKAFNLASEAPRSGPPCLKLGLRPRRSLRRVTGLRRLVLKLCE